MRVATGPDGASQPVGWDLGAVMVLGQGLGLSPCLVAEVMPAIEGHVVQAMRQNLADGDT
ncbi:MAG: hypothetical protein AAFR79_09075 [Pseudomonadota bacterium]